MMRDQSTCLKVCFFFNRYTAQQSTTCKCVCPNINTTFWLLDGTIDSQHQDGEEGADMSTAAPLISNVVSHFFLCKIKCNHINWTLEDKNINTL